VAASLTLRHATARARGTDAEPAIADALEQLRQGLSELRDLAHGIHPAILSERGLPAALEGLAARSAVPVELRATPERLPAAVEATIYFTIAEALTNVAKYAQASLVRVAVEATDGTLVAEVADDGVGGASTAAGSGLRGLADRLDALGGTLSLESARGAGTTVRAQVPLPQASGDSPALP
jgi:signal transduction histidine kinase